MSDEVIDLSLCDCCRTNPRRYVACSAYVPMSFGFCEECATKLAEPETVFDYLYMYVSERGEGLRDEVNELVTFKNGRYMPWPEWLTWRREQDLRVDSRIYPKVYSTFDMIEVDGGGNHQECYYVDAHFKGAVARVETLLAKMPDDELQLFATGERSVADAIAVKYGHEGAVAHTFLNLFFNGWAE